MNEQNKITKARTKAARRKKAKSGKISLAGGDKAKEPRAPGRKPQEDPRMANLRARAIRLGKTPTREILESMTAQHLGCEAGKAIEAQPITAVAKADMFAAVQHIRRAWLAYDRAIGAPNRHARVASILVPTAGMEATAASPAVDTRDDATRQRQAVAAVMQIEGWLGYVDKSAMSVVKSACLDEPDVPVRDVAGFISGLLCICEGIAGRRITYRGRG